MAGLRGFSVESPMNRQKGNMHSSRTSPGAISSWSLGCVYVVGILWFATADRLPAQTASKPSSSTTFDTEPVPESSGLVKSRQLDDVFWTLNDSGNSPNVFALDGDAKVLRSCEVMGVENRDWEDLAIDDAGNLYVGDIGNNASRRRDLTVYVVKEPNPRQDTEQACQLEVIRRLPFRYPDQPQPPDGKPRNFDSEALYWLDGSLFLLTKHREDRSTKLYQFVETEGSRNSPLVRVDLHHIGTFDLGAWASATGGTVTAADVSTDGRHLAVLSYTTIFVFERLDEDPNFLAHEPVVRFSPPREILKQCEAISWDGGDLIVTNEQGDLHRFDDVLVKQRRRLP